MIDTNFIKSDPHKISAALKSKKYDLNIEAFESLELNRKNVQMQTEDLQAQRNALSKEYGLLKQEGKDDEALNAKIGAIKTELDSCSEKLAVIQESFKNFLLDIPNIPSDSSPKGQGENDNVKVRDF
ncbi:MAG: serine--tRNA ligase, partial [Proteobacteria bacterium]|nr:serine--tRNA ligase [Pseudomonadota bacterium]